MHYILVALALIPLFWWGFPSNDVAGFWQLVAANAVSVFWMTAVTYLYDLFMAATGRNSPYMRQFYSENYKDLGVATFVGATLVLLLWSAPGGYNWSSIDLAAGGLPFAVYGIVETLQIRRAKLAGRKLPVAVPVGLAIVQICAYVAAAYSLSLILDGTVGSATSVWIQITVVSTALTFFFGTRQMWFIFKMERMEASPALRSLFDRFPGIAKLYAAADQAAALWNSELIKEKKRLQKSKRVEKKRNNKRS